MWHGVVLRPEGRSWLARYEEAPVGSSWELQAIPCLVSDASVQFQMFRMARATGSEPQEGGVWGLKSLWFGSGPPTEVEE